MAMEIGNFHVSEILAKYELENDIMHDFETEHKTQTLFPRKLLLWKSEVRFECSCEYRARSSTTC